MWSIISISSSLFSVHVNASKCTHLEAYIKASEIAGGAAYVAQLTVCRDAGGAYKYSIVLAVSGEN